MNSKTETRLVVVVPPPVTGMTIVSSAVAEMAEVHGGVVRKIHRKASDGQRRWTLRKQSTILRAICDPKFLGRREYLYVVADSGAGQVFNVFHFLAARALGKRLIVHHHVSSYLRNPTNLARVLLAASGPAAVHIVLDPAMAADLRASSGFVTQVTAINNAFALEGVIADRPHRTASVPLCLGFLGRLDAAKGIDQIEQVNSDLEANGFSVAWRIAGPAAADLRSRRAVESLSRLENVEFVGPLSGSKKSRFLASIDALAFPSCYQHEAQPMVIWEAAEQGTPTVAFKVGYVEEQVRLLGGSVVQSGDTKAMAMALAELANEPAARREARSQRTLKSGTDSAAMIVEHLFHG